MQIINKAQTDQSKAVVLNTSPTELKTDRLSLSRSINKPVLAYNDPEKRLTGKELNRVDSNNHGFDDANEYEQIIKGILVSVSPKNAWYTTSTEA